MPNITSVTGEAGTNTYTYVVPAGVYAKLMWLHALYTSAAAVGNRQLRLSITTAADAHIAGSHAGAVQAASLAYHYQFMQGIYRETAFIDSAIQAPIPYDIVLEPGWKIVVYDGAAISASDTMAIDFQYERLV